MATNLRKDSKESFGGHELDSPQELRARALRLLARREHTCTELERKLAIHAESPAVLAGILEALVEKKQLSDERYASERARWLSRKYGAAKIRHDLKARGVAAEVIDRVSSEGELERASAILQRKYREPVTTRKERAKRIRFLQGRGFSLDVITKAMSRTSKATEGDDSY